MLAVDAVPFGFLLRSLRVESALTQMELAERAGMSVRAVAALECGERRAPYRETVSALVRALEPSSNDAARLAAAATRARRRSSNAGARFGTSGNIPVQLTTFVGRQHLLQRAEAVLSSRRCVVLTGRAGVGKTRVALELAARLAPRFAYGAWLVDLSSVRDGDGVVAKTTAIVASTMSRTTNPNALAHGIGERNVLLVLDNCERVAPACSALVAAIRDACPNVAIVATSLVPLALETESSIVVEPLALPNARSVSTMDDLRTYASAELFIERCERYGYRFEPGNGAVPAISSVCRRLEGLPLAIELAASQAATLGIAGIEAMLARWLSSSTGAFVDVPERHRSLVAAIDWSHELLNESERIVFRRLSVFAGSFDMAAAVAVCSASPLNRTAVPELVLSLTDKSLLAVDAGSKSRRWSLFDSMRSYAKAKLVAAAEVRPVARAHAAYYATLYADGVERSYFASSSRWLRSVFVAADEIDAAVAWGSSEAGDPLVTARLVGNLLLYWSRTGSAREMQRIVDALLPRIDENDEPAAVAGLLLVRVADPRRRDAVTNGARAVELYRRCADPVGLAVAGVSLAHALIHADRPDDALAEIALAVTIAERTYPDIARGPTRFAATVRLGSGEAHARAGRWREAYGEYVAGLETSKSLGDDFAVRLLTVFIAETCFAMGEIGEAVARLETILEETRSTRDAYMERNLLANLAAYALVAGDTDAAARHVREALAVEHGEAFLLVCVLQHAATVLALHGRAVEAARLSGYIERFRATAAFERGLTEERCNAILVTSLAGQLTPAAIETYGREGAGLAEHEAVAIARA